MLIRTMLFRALVAGWVALTLVPPGLAQGSTGHERWFSVAIEPSTDVQQDPAVDANSIERVGAELQYRRRTWSRASPVPGWKEEVFRVDCANRSRGTPGGYRSALYPGTQEYEEERNVCMFGQQATGSDSPRVYPSGFGCSRLQAATYQDQCRSEKTHEANRTPSGASAAARISTPPPIAANANRSPKSSGSGFAVAPSAVVTNWHVVEECKSIAVRQGADDHVAVVKATAAQQDLALLRVNSPLGGSASVRDRGLLGEDVTVAGHPLAGLLSTDVVVTGGQVNSLAGARNDPTLLQISAPVQPGNSGGPVLDRAGAVVGVVVSKLNVQRLATLTGDLAQNVNFAIKPEVLRLFLEANGVPYKAVTLGRRLEGIEIARREKTFTVQILCFD